MNNLTYIISLTILTLIAGYLLPQWWMIAIISFVLAIVFKQSLLRSALISLITVGLVWFVTALMINVANDSILSDRVGELFGIGSIGMMAASALIGGLIACLAALTGASLQKNLQ